MTIELGDFHETDFMADKDNQNNGQLLLSRQLLQLSKSLKSRFIEVKIFLSIAA